MALREISKRCGLRHSGHRRPRTVRQQRTLPDGAGDFHQLRRGLRANYSPTLRPIWSSSPAGIATTCASCAWAVRTEARYIGMIGSKRKVLSVYQALEKEGFSPEEFKRVYAPMGLEIGALSPEEIAISIAAELVAVRRTAQSAQHKKLQREHREATTLRAR